MYPYQVLSMLKFITAERRGNWQLHLHCVEEIISHFHAAGHLQYAKSARLYLQQMNNLVHVMASDHTIEQYLMRMLKTSSGMTHGRGITDSTLTTWVHALPQCVPVCEAME